MGYRVSGFRVGVLVFMGLPEAKKPNNSVPASHHAYRRIYLLQSSAFRGQVSCRALRVRLR